MQASIDGVHLYKLKQSPCDVARHMTMISARLTSLLLNHASLTRSLGAGRSAQTSPRQCFGSHACSCCFSSSESLKSPLLFTRSNLSLPDVFPSAEDLICVRHHLPRTICFASCNVYAPDSLRSPTSGPSTKYECVNRSAQDGRFCGKKVSILARRSSDNGVQYGKCSLKFLSAYTGIE